MSPADQAPEVLDLPKTGSVTIETSTARTSDAPAKQKPIGYTWTWLGALLLYFVIFTVLFWLVYYSLKPSFVLQNDSNQIDTAKVLLAAVVSSFILVIIIWLVRLAIGKRY